MKITWATWWLCVLMFFINSSCISAPPAQYIYTHHQPADYTDRTINIYIDKSFGEADKIEMQKAVDQWNFALNGYIKINIAEEPFDGSVYMILRAQRERGWLFMKINKDDPIIPKDSTVSPDKPQYFIVAFCDKVGGDKTWFIRDLIGDNSKMYGITLHEMGHLLGANHNGKYLMSPHYDVNGYKCIDKGTMTQVSNFIGVPLKNLNYCLYEGD